MGGEHNVRAQTDIEVTSWAHPQSPTAPMSARAIQTELREVF